MTIMDNPLNGSASLHTRQRDQTAEFMHLLARAIENQRGMLGAMGQALNEIGGQITEIRTSLKQSVERQTADLAEMRAALTAIAQRQDCLEEMGQKLQMLTEQHYVAHVVAPAANRFCPIIDSFGLFLAHNSTETVKTEDALALLQWGRSQLVDCLGDLGLNVGYAEPGAEWEPKWMEPSWIPTNNKSEDKKVVRTIRCGFSRGDYLHRPATVAIYRYEVFSTELFDTPGKGERT